MFTVRSTSGKTGREVALEILHANIVLILTKLLKLEGFLTDHSILKKNCSLLLANYDEPSVAGTAIAAHEVGHAVQSPGIWFLRLEQHASCFNLQDPLSYMVACWYYNSNGNALINCFMDWCWFNVISDSGILLVTS